MVTDPVEAARGHVWDDADELGDRGGSAEIVLLDRRGIIVAANRAWRTSITSRKLPIHNAGLGTGYADVARIALSELNDPISARSDEDALRALLDDLLAGRRSHFEATYNHGGKLRQLRIAPLRIGDVTYLVAVTEDLTERERVEAELNEVSDQLLHAQEEERQRIAIELHDSTSQTLAAVVLALANMRRRAREDQGLQVLIDEMASLVQQAVRETRVLAFLMNASGQEQEGLAVSARRFVEGFGRRAGIKATFEVAGPVDATTPAAQHAVFRVIQEALANVHRHAHATRAVVSLTSRGGSLTLQIADNGRGMPRPSAHADNVPLGVGIPGMRSRLEQLGGTLEVTSDAGGTTVTATLPARRTVEAGRVST
jgi:signal transduction histidine kinase